MFDGIDQVVLMTPDAGADLRFYVDLLGFDAEPWVDDLPSHYSHLWHLPGGRLRSRLLTKPGSAGGSLRLVECPALPPAPVSRTMASPGPFSIDFYVRDLPGLIARLEQAGYRPRSELVTYELFGTSFRVDEIGFDGPQGFLHMLVEYLPRQHRCVLGDRPDLQVSEVVAAITVVDDVDEGLVLLRDVLGAAVYFDQRFEGPAIERLVGLPPGSGFRAVLLRGPARRNARAELAEAVPAAGRRVVDEDVPRMLLGLGVDDLDPVLDAVRDERVLGELRGPYELDSALHPATRVASLKTPWGALLELWERGGR